MDAAPTAPAFNLPETAEERPYFSPELLLARQLAQKRRAAAMVATHDTIMGLEFLPLTPASYSRLVTIGSPFLWRQPPTKKAGAAVLDYLWNHWPEFSATGKGLSAFLRKLDRTAFPWRLRWCYPKHVWQARTAKIYDEASEKIAELVGVAFADEPSPGDGNGRLVCASFEAQLIDLFAERYHWAPERTSATPLRQLFQLMRCNDRSDFTPDDAAIIADDLRRDNEAAIAAAAQKS